MSDRISVLYVVRPATGGIRRHVVSLIEHCDPALFDFRIAAPSALLESLEDTVRATRYPLEIPPKLSPGRDMACGARLAGLAGDCAVIVHAHGLRAGWIAAIAGRLRPFPLVLTAHNLTGSPTGAQRWAVRFVAARCSRIICVSDAVAAGFRDMDVCQDVIRVIPNGIDVDRFRRLPDRAEARSRMGIHESAFVVGAVARLSPEKGIDVLLSAAKRASNVLFVIAGEGPERANLTQTAPPNTRLIGPIADTRELLAAVDAVAVPSRQEGQGIVALECLAAGVPVIASRVGGLVETLTHEMNGLLVEPSDPVGLAQAIERLRTDPDLRSRLSQNGVELAASRFPMERMIVDVQQVYEDVMPESGSRRTARPPTLSL